jgi:hypothetical protein
MLPAGRYEPRSDPLIPHGCLLGDGGRQISEGPICWGAGVIRLNGLWRLSGLGQRLADQPQEKFGKPQANHAGRSLLDPQSSNVISFLSHSDAQETTLPFVSASAVLLETLHHHTQLDYPATRAMADNTPTHAETEQVNCHSSCSC